MLRSRTRVLWMVGLVAYFVILTVPGAYAYIDPGSGSFIFQVLIGALLGVSVAIKAFWGRITAFFSRRSSRGASDEV